jgi:hypothetical protein
MMLHAGVLEHRKTLSARKQGCESRSAVTGAAKPAPRRATMNSIRSGEHSSTWSARPQSNWRSCRGKQDCPSARLLFETNAHPRGQKLVRLESSRALISERTTYLSRVPVGSVASAQRPRTAYPCAAAASDEQTSTPARQVDAVPRPVTGLARRATLA